jgi:hypothetical protein
VLGDVGMRVETLDRAAGVIVPAGRTYRTSADEEAALRLADCGRTVVRAKSPSSVKYNIVIRGDSARAHVLVRAFYASCESSGAMESELETSIKAKAERG